MKFKSENDHAIYDNNDNLEHNGKDDGSRWHKSDWYVSLPG